MRSESPTPRRSIATTRAKPESRSRKRANPGSSQFAMRLEKNPGTNMRSRGPLPNTWKAMYTPSAVFAYRVSGISTDAS